MPHTVGISSVKALKEHPYHATIKMDGVRAEVSVTWDGLSIRVAGGDTAAATETADPDVVRSLSCVPCVLDAELMRESGILYVFDCLEFGGDTSSHLLSVRLAHAADCVRQLAAVFPVHMGPSRCIVKTFVPAASASDIWQSAMGDVALRTSVDGVVFEPEDPALSSYKWKPADRHSVDLWATYLCPCHDDASLSVLMVYPSKNEKPHPVDTDAGFEVRVRIPLDDVLTIRASSGGSRPCIVSLAMRQPGEPWVFECVRSDKKHANLVSTFRLCKQAYDEFVYLDDIVSFLRNPRMTYEMFVYMVRAQAQASGIIGRPDADAILARVGPLPVARFARFPADVQKYRSRFLRSPFFVPSMSGTSPDATDDRYRRYCVSLRNAAENGDVCPVGSVKADHLAPAVELQALIMENSALFVLPGSQYAFHPLFVNSTRRYARVDPRDPDMLAHDAMTGMPVWTDDDGRICAVGNSSAGVVQALQGRVDWEKFEQLAPRLRDILRASSAVAIDTGAESYYVSCSRAHELVRECIEPGPPATHQVYLVDRTLTRCVRFLRGKAHAMCHAVDLVAKHGSGVRAQTVELMLRRWGEFIRPQVADAAVPATRVEQYVLRHGLVPPDTSVERIHLMAEFINLFGYIPLPVDEQCGKHIASLALRTYSAPVSAATGGEAVCPSGTWLMSIAALSTRLILRYAHALYIHEGVRMDRERSVPYQYITRSVVAPYDLGVVRGGTQAPRYAMVLIPFPAGAVCLDTPARQQKKRANVVTTWDIGAGLMADSADAGRADTDQQELRAVLDALCNDDTLDDTFEQSVALAATSAVTELDAIAQQRDDAVRAMRRLEHAANKAGVQVSDALRLADDADVPEPSFVMDVEEEQEDGQVVSEEARPSEAESRKRRRLRALADEAALYAAFDGDDV